MSTPDEHGVTPRDRTRQLVRRGRSDLQRDLDGPSFPPALRYLWEWANEVRRGLGTGFDGINSLSWVALDAWSRHTGHTPAPHEIEALFDLDFAMRKPARVTRPDPAT